MGCFLDLFFFNEMFFLVVLKLASALDAPREKLQGILPGSSLAAGGAPWVKRELPVGAQGLGLADLALPPPSGRLGGGCGSPVG